MIADEAPRILVADDQPDVVEAVRLLLKRHGFEVQSALSPSAALQAIEAGPSFDVLLMDLNYARDTTSGREGLELATCVRQRDPNLPIVVMTAWSTVPLAVSLMRQGVGDFVEKPWDNAALLATLRTQVGEARRRRRAHRLAVDAVEVQNRLMSAELPQVEGVTLGAAWRFVETLGGDGHDAVVMNDGRLAVTIVDVCGKGTPAALLMANAQAVLRELLAAGHPPSVVCARLARVLAPRLGANRFLTLVLAVLDRPAGRLTYVNAGHPPPVLARAGGQVRRLQRGGPVIGVIADVEYEEGVLELRGGDRLVLFTDGVWEPDGAGDETLLERVRSVTGCDAREAAAALLATAGDEDDATVVVADVG